MKPNRAIRYPEIITDMYICCLMILYPLWIRIDGYIGVTKAKYDFFTVSTYLYIAAISIIIIELLLVGKSREVAAKFRRPSVTQICLLAYVICCCISALLSDYGSKVWIGAGRYEGLKTILLYAVLFFLISIFGEFKKRYLYLLGAAVLINTIISILQYAGYNPFTLFPEGYSYHDAYKLYANAFLGTIGNIDILSAFLTLAVPLFYTYYLRHDKSVIMLAPFAGGVFLLLLAGASAGIVGVGIGLAVTTPFVINSKQSLAKALDAVGIAALSSAVYSCLSFTYENRITEIQFHLGKMSIVLIIFGCVMLAFAYATRNIKKHNQLNVHRVRMVLISVVALGAVSGIAIIWAYPFSSGTLSELHQVFNGNISSGFGSGRIKIWQEVIKLIPEHFWFGGGPDALAERMTFTFQRYDETLGKNIESMIDTAHNDYLNILANTGVFSLLCYLSAILSTAVRAFRNTSGNKAVAIILPAIVCYLIQIFFSFSICIVSPFFLAFWGLLEASLQKKSEGEILK